jgi:RNA polymerase sigma-B factor
MVVKWGAQEELLLARVQRDGDRDALDELVRKMLPLARLLARKYQRRQEPLDDLTQVACLGLLKAIERFDPDRGSEFPAYAIPTMTGELKRYYRDVGWSVHVNRSLQERTMLVSRRFEELSRELGRSPTPDELAPRCELAVEEVLEARLAAGAYTALSLDAPEGSDGRPALYALADEDPRYLAVENASVLGSVLRALPQRERSILELRFGEELSQREIGRRLGISQMHVSRLMRRALDRVSCIAAKDDRAVAIPAEQQAA